MTIQKVLVVDDESGIRDMLRLALETADFECLEAGDTDIGTFQRARDSLASLYQPDFSWKMSQTLSTCSGGEVTHAVKDSAAAITATR